MTDKFTDNDDDRDTRWLDPYLAEIAREFRATASSTEQQAKLPSNDELDKYLGGKMGDEEKRRLQERLVKNPDALDALLRRAGVLPEPPPAPETSRISVAGSAIASGGAGGEQNWKQRASASIAGFADKWLHGRMALVPVAALVAVVAIGVWLRSTQGPDSVARVVDPGSARTAVALSDIRLRGDEEPAMQLPAAEKRVVVKLPVIVFPSGPAAQRVEVRTPSDTVVWNQRLTATDIKDHVLALELDLRLIPRGEYFLVVVDDTGQALAKSNFRR